MDFAAEIQTKRRLRWQDKQGNSVEIVLPLLDIAEAVERLWEAGVQDIEVQRLFWQKAYTLSPHRMKS
jgi:hypothetical protein